MVISGLAKSGGLCNNFDNNFPISKYLHLDTHIYKVITKYANNKSRLRVIISPPISTIVTAYKFLLDSVIPRDKVRPTTNNARNG